MTLYKNKWNKKIYKLVKSYNGKITLEREDGSKFEIRIEEFNSAYEAIH
jgi:hypothetical protein